MSDVAASLAGPRPRAVAVRLSWRLTPIALVTAVALVGATARVAAASPAGTYIDYLCETPAGEPVGSGGVEAQLWNGATRVSHAQSCEHTGQALTMTVGPSPGPYSNEQGGAFVYATPPGVTVSSYSVTLSADAPGCGELAGCPGGVGEVFLQHSRQRDPEYDTRDLGGGLVGLETVGASGLHGVSELTMAALCDAEGGDCPAGKAIASLTVPAGTFSLLDSTDPKVEDVSGPSPGAGPLAGIVEWGFKATDGASGVYTVVESIDGAPAGEEVIGDSTGRCKEVGAAGVRAFAAPQPCATEVTAAATLDTNHIPDGTHQVHIEVESAAGTLASVFSGSLTTDDGPTVETSPATSGLAEVGSPLTATDGVFRARAGQALVGVSGQWERCTAVSSCQPIAGATGTTYTPTPEDTGHTLMYAVTATAKVDDGSSAEGMTHSTTVDSVPTLPVAEEPGSPGSCAGPCTGVPGGDGGNGANGGNGGAGAGSSAGAGAGISVNLVAPGSEPSGSGLLGSAAPWRISLRVRPRRVHRHTRITLAGRVLTSPRPSGGKLVFLQARELRIVRRRVHGRLRDVRRPGNWITFMELRARVAGAFSTGYRFKLGGRHIYQFRAVAPAEGQYRNATGISGVVTVRER
jgi:hypothetical protein